MNSYKKCFLIPPTEKQCVWMSAGILSYQLCDRMFDCDCCPLDQAMRRRFSPPDTDLEDEAGFTADTIEQGILQEGCQYSRNHWWARRAGPRLIRLGIEFGLARALRGIRGIVFPALHQQMHRGKNCVWLVIEGGTLPLESPLDGVVRTVNNDLLSNPRLFGLQPRDDGWLLELEADDAEMAEAEWMSAGEAEVRYRSDQTRFLASVTGAVRGRRATGGVRFTDSGEKPQGFADILGPTRYFALVRQHFGWARR